MMARSCLASRLWRYDGCWKDCTLNVINAIFNEILYWTENQWSCLEKGLWAEIPSCLKHDLRKIALHALQFVDNRLGNAVQQRVANKTRLRAIISAQSRVRHLAYVSKSMDVEVGGFDWCKDFAKMKTWSWHLRLRKLFYLERVVLKPATWWHGRASRPLAAVAGHLQHELHPSRLESVQARFAGNRGGRSFRSAPTAVLQSETTNIIEIYYIFKQISIYKEASQTSISDHAIRTWMKNNFKLSTILFNHYLFRVHNMVKIPNLLRPNVWHKALSIDREIQITLW